VFYPIQEILKTPLVTRRVEREAKNSDSKSKQSDFATSYLETDGKVPSLFDIMWREAQQPSGITLQIDLREQDFAKAIAFYSYHISKLSLLYKDRQGVHRSKGWELFRSTILKGYNKHYTSFNDLHEDVKQKSVEAYGSNQFEIGHLHVFPPLIMVFFAKYLIKLARVTPPVDDPQGDRDSYEHIRHTFMNQVLSFVGVGVGSYNFILEIVHSGLGLGYNIIEHTATNPLNGELLIDKDVIFESRVDRAMIDVSVELRRRYPELLFSSCTRLPDVITPSGEYKAWHETSRLVRWENGEKGLSAKLRAMHGGLYPQSQLVVADDPASEIAARTWIDQKSQSCLDRSQLMHMPYNKWLARAPKDVIAAITKLNNQEFMPNKFGYPTTPGASGNKPDRAIELNAKVRAWMDWAVLSPKPIYNLGDATGYSVDKHWHDSENESKQSTASSQLSVVSGDDRQHDEVLSTWENRPRNHFSDASSDPIILRIWGKEYLFENVVDVKRTVAGIAAYEAAEEGNEQTIRDLLAVGANINALTGYYGTPLAVACERGHATVVKLLLDAGAEVKMGGMRGFQRTPLERAAAAGHRDVVEMLLTVLQKQPHHGISKDLRIGDALHEASGAGHDAVVALLLDAGADIDCRDRFGQTALERACGPHGWRDVINLLLTRGADVNAPGRASNASALESACRLGDLDVTTLLLKKGAVIDFPLDEIFKPDIVSLLVEHKPDIAQKPPRNSEREAQLVTRRVRPDPSMEHFRETSLRVRKQKKPVPPGPKWLSAPQEVRNCGCLLCFIDGKSQLPIGQHLLDSALWRTKQRKAPPATIADPVSVTLREMGKLTMVDRPRKNMHLFYNFDEPPTQ
jgi:hypothetical protein